MDDKRGGRRRGRRGTSSELPADPPAGLVSRADVEQVIDQFIEAAGLKPADQIGPNGWRHFRLGSASGFAFVDEVEGQLYFHAAARVMAIPSDRDLILPLFRELLEINGTLQGSARLAVRDNDVFVAVCHALGADLRPRDIVFSIHQVMRLADRLDDVLTAKYGGTTRQKRDPGPTR